MVDNVTVSLNSTPADFSKDAGVNNIMCHISFEFNICREDNANNMERKCWIIAIHYAEPNRDALQITNCISLLTCWLSLFSLLFKLKFLADTCQFQ